MADSSRDVMSLPDLVHGRLRAGPVRVADDPMSAVHGRVRYHPCTSVCNRADLAGAVLIHARESFGGGMAAERGRAFAADPCKEH
jgi:hypothetical protein